MKHSLASRFPAALAALAATSALALSASPAPDLTNPTVPNFRGWESSFYAGWTDWSNVTPDGFYALPDDPASNVQFARVARSINAVGLFSGGPGILCTDGNPSPEIQYSGPFGMPIHEVIVQVKGVGPTLPTLSLQYVGDVPFNPDPDYLIPIEVVEQAPGEVRYRFLAAVDGLSLGTFGDFYSFIITLDVPGQPSPGCIDAIQLDVRHSLMGETQAACSSGQSNSLGVSAGIDAGGSSFAADNLFQLTASGIPQASYGFFIASETLAFVPCPTNCGPTQGQLCLGGTIARLLPAGLGGSDYSFSRVVDLTSIPLSPPVAVTAGTTWHFQGWYRDANPTVTSNFTQTISVLFR